jgi:hypothetical protein
MKARLPLCELFGSFCAAKHVIAKEKNSRDDMPNELNGCPHFYFFRISIRENCGEVAGMERELCIFLLLPIPANAPMNS